MAEFFVLLRSFGCRLIFICHGIISIYLLSDNLKKSHLWFLGLPLLLLLAETVYTLVWRKGKEYKYFWPSGFLYILTIIPMIWIAELELVNIRIYQLESVNASLVEEEKQVRYQGILRLTSSYEIVVVQKVCELGLILGLLLGRWLMPRGAITRDQLSALLLSYAGNAADIIEIFDAFEEPSIAHNKSVAIGVIAVYTWSILQFSLVTTATLENREEMRQKEEEKRKRMECEDNLPPNDLKESPEIRENYIQRIRKQSSVSSKLSRGKGKKNSVLSDFNFAKNDESREIDKKIERRKLHGELFQILVLLFMQDGPFLIVRLYLFIEYNVDSEMHIFFTCKNAIVSALLVYRLCVLTCHEPHEEAHDLSREECAWKLHNVQMAMVSQHVVDKQKTIHLFNKN